MKITTAMIMAAGRGKRMGPLGDELPKPLLRLHNKKLIHHVVDRIADYGIKDIVVNTCYKGDLIQKELKKNEKVTFFFSEEESALETGGGVKRALPSLLARGGENGFFVLNSDTVWFEPSVSVLERLEQAWDPDKMDILLSLVPVSQARGDLGPSNYFIENGKIRRIRPDELYADYFFIGAQIMHPRVFERTPDTPFSSRDLFDKAQEEGRLGYVMHDGLWFNINTPQALAIAESECNP